MSKEKDLAVGRELVRLLDDLLATGDWDASLFLRNSKKRFLKLRDEAATAVKELGGPEIELKQREMAVPDGYIKVYISLYQTEGSNLQIWQNVLSSLSQHSISRPIYDNEENIQELIRSKPALQRHAYVAVAVRQEGVISNGHVRRDTLGHELVMLREGSVESQNILEFVHANKKRYSYQSGVLTPTD